MDGDQILALLAVALKDRGRLVDDTLVATVMATSASIRPWREAGIKVRRPRSATATCSRTCAPAGYSLGGEQSGHLILADHATTGDGLLSALHLMAAMARIRARRWPSSRRS